MQKSIEKSATFNHPIEKVWNAITNASEISKWFLKADFKPEKGYKGSFDHEGTIIQIEVLEVEKPTKLVYTWHVTQYEPAPTTVTMELSEKNGKTTVVITHSDLDKLGEDQKTFAPKFAEGWKGFLSQLGKYLG